MNEEHDCTNWNPLSVAEVGELLSDLRAEWWIAGGYAIEMFAGRPIRSHGDIDILVKRDDQHIIQKHLSAWELYSARYPGLRLWGEGETLIGRYHDIWCRPKGETPWRLQIMLLDTEGDVWFFRNNPSIFGSVRNMSRMTGSGIRYLSPEIQLLYKAGANMLEKDETDFAVAAPMLNEAERAWLLENLRKRFPAEHQWIEKLKAVTEKVSLG